MQRIAVYQVVGAADVDDEDDEQELAAFANEISPEDVQLFYQIALIGRRDLYLAPDPKSGAEMTLLRMLAFQPADTVRTSVASARLPAEKTTPRKQESKAVEWQDPDWSELVGNMGLSGAAKMLASNCALLRRDKNVVHLRLDEKSESFLTKSAEAALKDALGRHFGESLRVAISIGETKTATPAQQEARRVDAQYEAARASIEADPNVKALKDLFGAEINADSIEPLRNQPPANQE